MSNGSGGIAPEVIESILGFWFDDGAFAETVRDAWFESDPAFDADIARRFSAATESALEGGLSEWAHTPRACLALLLLLDQFPRNLYRGRARAFAGDERARAVANTAIDNGFDQLHAVVERYFFYLPLMHSEDLADQDRAIALFESLPPHEGRERAVKSAYDHREAIVRFGRFPHRNRALGRETTEDEAAYLAEQAERNDAHWTQAQGSHHAEAVAQDSDEQAEKAGGS